MLCLAFVFFVLAIFIVQIFITKNVLAPIEQIMNVFNDIKATQDYSKRLPKSNSVEMNQLSGPVGVTQMIGEVASTRDYSSIFLMTAFITISIGVFNLLPLPALDGGRLLFLVLELIRGKPVAPKYEGYVHAAGLFLLMGLMLVVTFNDIVRLISG